MSRWNPTFECWEVFTASYDKSMIVWLVQDKVNSKGVTSPIRFGSRESLKKTKSNEVGTLNLEALNNNDYSDCDDSTSTRSDNSVTFFLIYIVVN
jgi:alpha-D-ribose 1-methylphosphonate 5-triphosphate synthase subunit PhnH